MEGKRQRFEELNHRFGEEEMILGQARTTPNEEGRGEEVGSLMDDLRSKNRWEEIFKRNLWFEGEEMESF